MKRVAVINDLSGLGKCSLTASIPVLSVMQAQPCPIPTAVLTNQTGFDSFYCDDYTDKLDIFAEQWDKMGMTFDGIITGYFVSEEQINKVLSFIARFKKDNTKLFVDPVMGDGGSIYSTYTTALCKKVCSLALHADVITPNLTELCVLTGADYAQIEAIANDEEFLKRIEALAMSLVEKGVGAVIVTGLVRGANMYNGVFRKSHAHYCKTRSLAGRYSGTGDLFSAVICGASLRGDDLEKAVRLAAEFIERSVEDTLKYDIDPNYGVNFEKYLTMLANIL